MRACKTPQTPRGWSCCASEPPVLLDGAHNPNGIAALERAIEDFLPSAPITCVMGMLADKDIDSSIQLLKGLFSARLHRARRQSRALGAEALAEKFRAAYDDANAFDSAR